MSDQSGPVSDAEATALPAIRVVPPRPSQGSAEVGIVLYAPGATLGPRVQPDYELVLMHTGAAHVVVDGVERHIAAGHVGLFRPGGLEYFAFAGDQKTRHSWIALAPQRVDEAARRALDTATSILPLSSALHTCVELARVVAEADEPTEQPVLTAAARTALALYVVEATQLTMAHTMEHSAVAHARQVARRRAVEGISVRELAQDVGLSPEHLVRLFRRHTGQTLVALLREERLAHAIRLLEHTGLSVAEVAQQSGFASPHHFARCLRAATAMTPTELRRWSWAVPPAAGPDARADLGAAGATSLSPQER